MSQIAGYILAGGKSTRMGSDKGMLPLNKSVFIAHIVQTLKAASVESITIVSSNTDYDFLNCNRINDVYPGKGPVGGIFTALRHSTTAYNIILSVDIPLISADVINWLIANRNEEKQITQVRVGDKTNPLIAVYNKDLVSIFEDHIKKDQLKLIGIVDSIPHQTIAIPKKWTALLQNINTKEDYQNLLK